MWTSKLPKKYRSVWAYILFARCSSEANLNLKRVLLLSKRTRYELEKLHRPGITDQQLEQIIRKRGSDYDTLIRHHHLHKDFHNKLMSEFLSNGIDVISVNRTDYTDDAIKWADIVVPVGGDGNFLLAASKITSRDKPIVGFNSDPTRSEGYLCLPKAYTAHFSRAVKKLLKNEFSWLFRSRIEVKLTGPRAGEKSINLDECPVPSFYWWERDVSDTEVKQAVTHVLPHLALNEVFLGESLSSQVSYFEVEMPGQVKTKVKCSGLCVCTGTGSTSWHLSINRLSTFKVERILRLAGVKPIQVHSITKKFNDSLVFSPEDPRMFYTLRDLICAGVWPDPPGLPSDDFTREITVSSKCHSANLVIDGGRCYSFNDGTSAMLSTRPGIALRTIVLN